jgi:hypothetical protein
MTIITAAMVLANSFTGGIIPEWIVAEVAVVLMKTKMTAAAAGRHE